MKKWIISLNLLFYITFLNQWNFAESHPTSSSRAGQSAGTSRARGQTSTHKSGSPTSETGTGTKVKSSSHPASSGSRSTPTTTTSGCTQPSRAGSTIPANTTTTTTTSTPTSGSTTPTSKSSSGTGKSQQRQSITSTNPGNEGTLVTLDINKSKDTDQFNYKKNGNFRTYTPKPGYLFTKIVKKDLDIWTAKPNDHGLKAVLMGSKKEPKHLAILLQNKMFILLRKSGKNKPWQDITSQRHDITNFKFFAEGDTSLRSSDYEVSLVDLLFTYTFNSGVTCKKITYNDKNLWTHTDDTNFSEIKSFSLDLASNQFSLTNTSNNKKELTTKVALEISRTQSTDEFDHTDESGVVTFKPKDNHIFNKVLMKKKIGSDKILWESKDDLYATMVRINSKNASRLDGVCVILAILLTDDTFKFFIHNYGNWQDITKDRYDVKKLKFLGENDAELTKSDYKVTLVDFSFTYIFNDGVVCKKVMYADDEVWCPNDDPKFSEIKSFSLGLASNKFFVKNSSDTTKELGIKHSTTPKSQCQSGSTKPTPVTATVITKVSVTKPAPKGTPVTVDISKTESITEFDYSDHNGVVTYKPKSDNVINKVVEGTKVIWESSGDVCGSLVRTKVSKNVKYLAILMTNSLFTLFHLDGSEWKDITKDRHDITKLKFLDENDTEISKTHYSVTIEFLSYQFTFKTGVKCRKILFGDAEVWKHTDDTNFSSLKSFALGLASNKFFVKNKSDELKKIEKDFKHITTPASQIRSGKPASTPPSGGTQPSETSSATSASHQARSGSKTAQTRSSGTTRAKTTPTSGASSDTQPSRTS